jgi:hypothetical protein
MVYPELASQMPTYTGPIVPALVHGWSPVPKSESAGGHCRTLRGNPYICQPQASAGVSLDSRDCGPGRHQRNGRVTWRP